MSTEAQDAARYRWLRAANNGVCVVMPIWPDDARTMETEALDAAVDAAMGTDDPGVMGTATAPALLYPSELVEGLLVGEDGRYYRAAAGVEGRKK